MAKCTEPKLLVGGNPINKRTALGILAHLFIFLALSLQADASWNPFHRKPKPAPHIPLTMESDISTHGHHLMVEEYILAYQAVRDSIHRFTDDEKPAEVESGEIAAVQADLDAMSEIADPEHDPKLAVLADKLATDVTDLVGLDIALQTLTPISWHKPKANKQWDRDLRYIRTSLMEMSANPNDHWVIESTAAYYRAIDDYENYLGGDKTISTERIENDINEARFDLHCIGSHLCDLQKQNEGN